MSAQDRMYTVMPSISFGLEPKTADVLRLPSIYDYEPQPSRRFTEFFVMMRLNRLMKSINDWYLPLEGMLPPNFNRRLLDLSGARYLLVEKSVDTVNKVFATQPLERIASNEQVIVYENRQAFPRARFVPKLEVEPDSAKILTRMAHGKDDLRNVAFVERKPASGFVGGDGPASPGYVRFITNHPETVTLEVLSPQRGFLVLTDQHAPGWSAAVNGQPSEILLANHAFRAIEVPAGASTVEFRYRPWSVILGALASALSISGVLYGLFRTRAREQIARGVAAHAHGDR
jgi:hypothetical protein